MTEANASNAGCVWIADDDRSIRWVLSKALSREGIQSRTFENGDELLTALKGTVPQELPQALVTDIRMPGVSGLDLLPLIKEQASNIPVIVMTAFTDLDSAVSSFQKGAFEYLTKPFDINKAVDLIKRAIAEIHTQGLHKEDHLYAASLESSDDYQQNADSIPLIGQAPAMQDIFRVVGRLSCSTATVLLTGESGTGKEVVARTIWKHSPRNQAPFVAINVAAIPKELLESELFGHEKGSFTGAVSTYQGRFEQAKGGTLFLDEIGDMPMELQTRLLRVLSNGFFYRVGGKKAIKSDVRIIAATNKDLTAQVLNKSFREDLFYRLNVIHINIPPLRERADDVPYLVEYFLNRKAKDLGVDKKRITKDAMGILKEYSYPGNVRELENIVQRLLIMVPGVEIQKEDLFEVLDELKMIGSSVKDSKDFGLPEVVRSLFYDEKNNGNKSIWTSVMQTVEKALIDVALKESGNKKERAALFLGIGRNTLSRKMNILKMNDE